jgi:developmental checkpoint coupling sporulation initiation to replication initiation
MSNETLIDSYWKAIELKLEKDFVELLLAEIKRRRLQLESGYHMLQQAAAN